MLPCAIELFETASYLSFSYLVVLAILFLSYWCYHSQAQRLQDQRAYYRERQQIQRITRESQVDSRQLLEDGIVRPSYGAAAAV